MEAYITGIGWVTGNGPGWGAKGGETLYSDLPLPHLMRKDVFPEPNQRFGRQSDYSKLGFSAIALALRDAELEQWSEKRPIGVVAATKLGCLATDVDYRRALLPEGGGLASPNLFAYTLASCFLGEAAIQFGLSGSSFALNDTDPDGLASLRTALECLAIGESETMLAGLLDLDTPAGMDTGVALQPGALFFVITRLKPEHHSGYGSVTLADDGSLLRNGTALTSFLALVEAVLAGRRL